MRSLIVLCLALLLPAAAQAGVIYSENFEDGVFDGVTAGNTLPGGLAPVGLWHVTQNNPASGTSALGFVRNETAGPTPNGTYANDGTGTVYTPPILLPTGTGPVVLSFDVANYGRGDTYYDRFDIGVYVGGSHYVKASTYPGYAGLGAQIYTENDGYHAMSAILDAYAGQSIRIYIHYSVIQTTPNNYAGGRIDNLLIKDSSAVPEPGMLGLLGAGLAGLGLARRKRR